MTTWLDSHRCSIIFLMLNQKLSEEILAVDVIRVIKDQSIVDSNERLTSLLELVKLELARREAVGHGLNDIGKQAFCLISCLVLVFWLPLAPNGEHLGEVEVLLPVLVLQLHELVPPFETFFLMHELFQLALVSLCQLDVLELFKG